MKQEPTKKKTTIRNWILGLAPNFRSGFSSVFAPARNKEIYDMLLHRSINDGLRSDWNAIGNDLRTAMNKFNAETSWKKI